MYGHCGERVDSDDEEGRSELPLVSETIVAAFYRVIVNKSGFDPIMNFGRFFGSLH